MKKLCFITLFPIVLLTISCSKRVSTETLPPGYNPPAPVYLPESRVNNVAYGRHPAQTMDILLPAGRNKIHTKLIVMVHGGQWTAGDKSLMEGYISLLKPKLPDFAFANINYRLVNGQDILISTPEQDIKMALEYLWTRTDSFQISKKTVLMGESAGGQLALINAYKSGSANIKVAIGLKTPSDLGNWYSISLNPQIRPLLEYITSGTPLTHPLTYFNASPINFVTAGDPATLLIHGDGDSYVNTQLSLNLMSKLEACGITNQLILLTGEAHSFTLNGQLMVYDHIASFLSNSNLFR